MNHILNSITENFPDIEGCYLLPTDGTLDPKINELSKNTLIEPWIKWLQANIRDFEDGIIYINDESQLITKKLKESLLFILNKKENITLITNFVNTISIEIQETVEKSSSSNSMVIEKPLVDVKMMDAVRIQKLIIPKQEDIKKEFKDFFVVHEQQDVVGGDFYWYARKDDNVLLAIVDCTGHSIEGAMTSMVCNSLLNQSFTDFDPNNLSELLVRFYDQIINYNKTTSDIGDYGMGAEIGLFNFNYKKSTITFSSTGISAFIKRTNGIEYLKSRKIINYQNIEQSIYEITFKMEGIIGIYGFTDGLIDQFDSDDKKKLGRRGILKMIEEEKHFNAEYYLSEINKWKGNNMQYDDITLVGIAI
ncbi:MAG: SpoIIE family protein phosphatase [Marinoscillum sp.]